LEIGSAGGGTCRFLTEAVGFRQVYIVDDGKHPDACYQADNLRHVPNLQRFVGDSHSPAAADFLRQHVIDPLDVIFVDGDHSYGGAWLDAKLALRFSRPGTVLVFHDTAACRGVELAWLRSVRKKLIRPLAEYVGDEVPLGIGLGEVL
jgi:predicted O-methyltransferase YrrM